MIDRRHFPLFAGLGLVAVSLWPVTAIHAQDPEHGNDKIWSEKLASDIKAQVKTGMAAGAVGMEKGADKMLRGADRMETYADRLEQDADFREREATRQNERNDRQVTAQQLLESVPKMRRG
ncbi:hypothetical protein, partial [Parasphingorhabdus sp.]|uniref:hypothetical protein n=1 Tax=Parasphingorhabdus sp. TaxID=2709688 RepID=UPI003593E8CD